MKHTNVGLCHIEFYLPGVRSLKEKRSIIKPILTRLQKTFNVACAETDYQDKWQSAAIAIVTVSNASKHTHQVLQSVLEWIENNFPDAMITRHEIEIL